MKTKIRFLIIFGLIAVVCITLVGCSSYGTSDFVSPANPMDYGLLNQQQNNLTANLTNWENAYYAPDTPDAQRTILRERIVYGLVGLDDEYYRKWVSDFYGRSSLATTIAETAEPVLSGASAATSGDAATVLALISTGVGAANVSFAKNFLQQSAISLLTSQCDALRTTIMVRINSNMTNSVSVYSLGRALTDVQDYALAGSLPMAAAAIQASAGATKNSATTNLTIGAGSSVPATSVPASPTIAGNTLITATPNPVSADVGAATITVQAMDTNNNPMAKSAGDVALSTSVGTLGVNPIKDNGNGTYTTTFTGNTVGAATISGTIAAAKIGHSLTLIVTPGAVSTAQTTITCSQYSLAADGKSHCLITVQAMDAHNNKELASCGVITLSATAGLVAPATANDNHDGTYTATLTSASNPGIATITGTIDGNNIANKALVNFIQN